MKTLLIETDTRLANLQSTAQLANALSRQIEVAAVAPTGVAREYFAPTVKVVEVPMGVTKKSFVPALSPFRLRQFLAAIQGEHPDIIHFREPFHIWPALLLPWLRQYKIVTGFFEVVPHVSRPDKLISRWLYLKFSRCLTAVSNIEKGNLESLGVTKKCYVIPEGAHSVFAQYARENVAETESVLFFGIIEERKGLRYLLEAAPVIAARAPGVKIIIAGRGDLSPYAGLIAGAPNLELLNSFIPDEQVTGLFQQAKVIVLPYTTATGSSVLSVAQALGKPVVVAEVGSFAELVEHGLTGLVVPPRDSRALAEAIIQLLADDDLRKAMGRNALRKAKEELSWERIAAQTIDMYRDVLKNDVN